MHCLIQLLSLCHRYCFVKVFQMTVSFSRFQLLLFNNAFGLCSILHNPFTEHPLKVKHCFEGS